MWGKHPKIQHHTSDTKNPTNINLLRSRAVKEKYFFGKQPQHRPSCTSAPCMDVFVFLHSFLAEELLLLSITAQNDGAFGDGHARETET